MNEWDQAFGYGGGRDPMQEQKIKYLYGLAAQNPSNAGLASNYLDAYTNYAFPTTDPYLEALGLAGGTGGGSGLDTSAYTAFMEGRSPILRDTSGNVSMLDFGPDNQNVGQVLGMLSPEEQWNYVGENPAAAAEAGLQIGYDENGDPYIDIPDSEYEKFASTQGVWPAVKRNVGDFLTSPYSGTIAAPFFAMDKWGRQVSPMLENGNYRTVWQNVTRDPSLLFKTPADALGMSKEDYYNQYVR